MTDENTLKRKFASTEYQTYHQQVMSPARSSLSHPGWAIVEGTEVIVVNRDDENSNCNFFCTVITIKIKGIFSLDLKKKHVKNYFSLDM